MTTFDKAIRAEATWMALAADLTDLLDPDVSEDARFAVAEKAAAQDPLGAVYVLAGMAQSLVTQLGQLHPEGHAGFMREMRANFAATPPTSTSDQ